MFGLGKLAHPGQATSGLSVPKRVAALLRRFNASLILPGEQTPVLGPELVVNGDNEAQLAGIGPASRGTVTRSTERAYAGVASAKYVCNDASTGAHTVSLANVSAKQSIFVECWVFADTGNFANIDLFDFNDGSWVTSSISVKGQWARLTGVRPAKGSAWNLRVGDRAFTSNLGQSFYIDNISVREILSYSDTINGFRTGNWTDSVGSIPATIDGKTGLVIDAAGSVGDNVAPALEAANWSVIGNDATHIVTWQTGGGFRYQSDTTSPTLMVSKSGILTPGKTYELILNCSSYVSGSLKIDATTIGAIQLASSAGISRCVFTATASTLTLYRNTTNVDLTVSSLQVRELTGIHALQATDGFKPVERRGLVNLLTYSNDFSNAAWSALANPAHYTLSDEGSEPISGLGKGKTVTATGSPASTYIAKSSFAPSITFAMVAKPGTHTGAILAVRNITTATMLTGCLLSSGSETYGTTYGSSSRLALSNGWYLYTITVTSGFSSTDSLGFYTGATGAVAAGLNWHLHSAALFQGTVTAQQILDAGGIPVTTTEPKSSSLGPRYLQFEDARATRMLLSKQPFDFMGDWCVVFAASCDSNDSVVDAVFANCYSVNNDGMYMGFFQGKPILSLKTGAVTSLLQPTTLAVDTPVVVSARKIGNTVQLRVNSVLVGETTKVWTTPTAPDTFSIGSIGSNYFLNGKLHALGYSGGTYSDAELLLLEKFAGKLAGVQI